MKRAKKNRKKRLILPAIITGALALCFIVAILITNAFMPIKYFNAYLVKKVTRADGVEITFIDVGFGDCAYVSLPDGKNILIDGGNGDYANTEKILKVLNSHGVQTINYLICTSVKDEHSGGLAEIVKYKKVEVAYIPYCKNQRITAGYSALVSQHQKSKVQCVYAGTGCGVADEKCGYYITFLSPINYVSDGSEYNGLNEKPNSENVETASAVIWLEYLGKAVIFTSDVRPAVLQRIVDDYEQCVLKGDPYCQVGSMSVQLKKCKVVTAPAHGGERNTSADWYGYIQPDYTVISVGKNFADYPSSVAIADILTYSNALYTSYSGNITVTFNGDGYFVKEQKSGAKAK